MTRHDVGGLRIPSQHFFSSPSLTTATTIESSWAACRPDLPRCEGPLWIMHVEAGAPAGLEGGWAVMARDISTCLAQVCITCRTGCRG